jgi:hypothetical protein
MQAQSIYDTMQAQHVWRQQITQQCRCLRQSKQVCRQAPVPLERGTASGCATAPQWMAHMQGPDTQTTRAHTKETLGAALMTINSSTPHPSAPCETKCRHKPHSLEHCTSPPKPRGLQHVGERRAAQLACTAHTLLGRHVLHSSMAPAAAPAPVRKHLQPLQRNR